MKVAWLATSGPEDKCGEALARLEVIADTYLSMSTPVQLATPVLLEQRKSFQPLLLDRLRTNREELDRQLEKHTTCRRLQVEGGWYAMLQVPVTRSDEELVIELLQKHSVVVHPGHFYDFPTDGCLVVSLITPLQDFREGISRLLEFMK